MSTLTLPLSDCTSAYQNADNIQLNAKAATVYPYSFSYPLSAPGSPLSTASSGYYTHNPYHFALVELTSSDVSFEDCYGGEKEKEVPSTPTRPRPSARSYSGKDRWQPTADGAPSARPVVPSFYESARQERRSSGGTIPTLHSLGLPTQSPARPTKASPPTSPTTKTSNNGSVVVRTVVAALPVDRSSGRPVLRGAVTTSVVY